jgi:amino-acid N-acetyltransferase
VIRRVRPGDLPRVLALLQSEQLPVDGVDEHFGSFVVFEEHGAVLGAAGMEVYDEAALLRSLAVAAGARNRGLASAMTRAVLDDARSLGIRAVYLLTTTGEGFFPRFGFARIERAELPAALHASRELQGACPTSAVPMRLALQ